MNHLQIFKNHPVLIQEIERFLLSDKCREEKFEKIAKSTLIREGTTRIHDDMYIHYRRGRTIRGVVINVLMVLEDERPTGLRSNIIGFECAIIGTVSLEYDSNGDRLTMFPVESHQVLNWRCADEDEMGVAALKLMAFNRA